MLIRLLGALGLLLFVPGLMAGTASVAFVLLNPDSLRARLPLAQASIAVSLSATGLGLLLLKIAARLTPPDPKD